MLTIQDEKSKLQAATGLLEEISTIQAQLHYATKMDNVYTIIGSIDRISYNIYVPLSEEINDGVKRAIGNLLNELSAYYAERLKTAEAEYAALFSPTEPAAK